MVFRISPVYKRHFDRQRSVTEYRDEEITTLVVDEETGEVVEEKSIVQVPVTSIQSVLTSPRHPGLSMRNNTKASFM